MAEEEFDSNEDGSVLAFPDLEDRLDETIVNTAAHVLHRGLLKAGEIWDNIIPSRIRGIETPEEIAAY